MSSPEGPPEAAPLLNEQAPPEPEQEETIFEVLTKTGPDADYDGSVCSASQTFRGRTRGRTTIVLDEAAEKDLNRTRRGQGFVAFLQSGVGTALQALLLLAVLGIYTFTPEVIAWSKLTSYGLSGHYVVAQDAGLPHARVERRSEPALDGSELGLSFEEPMVATWTAALQVPTSGQYAFELQGVDEGSGSVAIEPPGESALELPARARGRVLATASVQPGGAPRARPRRLARLEADVDAQGAWGAFAAPAASGEGQDGEDPGPSLAELGLAQGQQFVGEFELGKKYALRVKAHVQQNSKVRLVVTPFGEEARTVPHTWLTHDGTPLKGKPYLDASPTLFTELALVFTSLVASFAYGGLKCVKQCFALKNLTAYAPVGFCFVAGDILEILANGMLDSTTYIVVSQARLLGTAVCMRLLLGTSLNTLQWVDLTVLSFLIFVFVTVPADFHAPEDAREGTAFVTGLCFTGGKVFASVVAGVYMQMKMQSPDQVGVPFCVQLLGISLTGALVAAGLLPLVCWFVETPLTTYGLFGGPDGGWDYRTIAVVALYTCREWAMNLVVKRFDSLVKNLCNALASLCSYLFAMLVVKRVAGLHVCEEALGGPKGLVRTEQEQECRFNQACLVKLVIISGVVLLVYNYAAGKRYVSVKAGEGRKETPVHTLGRAGSAGAKASYERGTSRTSTLGTPRVGSPSAASYATPRSPASPGAAKG